MTQDQGSLMPSRQDAIACRSCLLMAGGVLPVGNTEFESDFSQYIIERVAHFTVIEGIRYWKMKAEPNLAGLPEDPQIVTNDDQDIPF